MNKRFAVLAIAAVVSALFLGSCRSKRAIIRAPLKEMGEQYLLEQMEKAETKFEYFNARCAISVVGDKKNKIDLKGQIRIKKDSIIWMSLSPAFGIEVARLVVTEDSVRFINRLDKTYFDDDFSFIQQMFSSTIDFDLFQALLTGNDLSWYDDENFKASVEAMEYRLTAAQRVRRKRYLKQQDTAKFLVQSIWLNPDNFKINRLNIKEFGDETKRMQACYDAFEPINGQLFPSSIRFDISGAAKAGLRLECNKMEIDQPLEFPFRIPENYQKMK